MFEGLYAHCGAFKNPTACFLSFFIIFLLYVLLVCNLAYTFICILNTHTHTHTHTYLHSAVLCYFVRLLTSVVSFLQHVPFQRWICFLHSADLGWAQIALRWSGREFTYSSLSLCQFLLLLSGIFFLVSEKSLSFFRYRFLGEGPLPEILYKFCFWLKSIFSYVLLINAIYPCACAYLSSL